MNRKYDEGSLSVLVLDEGNLQFVSENGVKEKNNPNYTLNSSANLDNGFDEEYNIVKIECRNQHLLGKHHVAYGVPFVKKQFKVDNRLLQVVVPEFEGEFDAWLPENLYMAKDKLQFKECFRQLYEALQNDAKLRQRFSQIQIEQIKNGRKLDNYVWHHDVPPGKMKLVNSEMHDKTGHTGGRFIWGGGSRKR